MLIKPQQKHRDKLFYNNILLIITIFSIICLWTSIKISAESPNYDILKTSGKPFAQMINEPYEGMIWGPINVDKKSQIFKITANFYGENSSSYLIGEVLDEEKETLYEFGKDMWHESGYDSEGYWSESERRMTTYLTFKEKGTYYLQFSTEPDYSTQTLEDIMNEQKSNTPKKIKDISITIQPVQKSYVPHSKAGTLALLLAIGFFCFLNHIWVKEVLVKINEKLEEMSDD